MEIVLAVIVYVIGASVIGVLFRYLITFVFLLPAILAGFIKKQNAQEKVSMFVKTLFAGAYGYFYFYLIYTITINTPTLYFGGHWASVPLIFKIISMIWSIFVAASFENSLLLWVICPLNLLLTWFGAWEYTFPLALISLIISMIYNIRSISKPPITADFEQNDIKN